MNLLMIFTILLNVLVILKVLKLISIPWIIILVPSITVFGTWTILTVRALAESIYNLINKKENKNDRSN